VTGGTWVSAKDVLHVTVNRVSGSLRGRSDLAPVLPYVRRYREWLDDRILQNKFKSSVVWDVTVSGADHAEIQRMRAQNAAPPARGTVLFHNEGEMWKPVQPEINAGDAAPDGRAIRLMVATGRCCPSTTWRRAGMPTGRRPPRWGCRRSSDSSADSSCSGRC
jgi:hypothetical protein